MEHRHLFAKSELANFFFKHSGNYLSDIDDPVIEYMVSIIEEIGGNPEDAETDFDVDEFTEMISQFICGFDQIKSVTIFDWLFNLARKIEDGSYLKSSITFPEKPSSTCEVSATDIKEEVLPREDVNDEDNYVEADPSSPFSVDIPNSLKWLCSSEPSSNPLFEHEQVNRLDGMFNVMDLNVNGSNLFNISPTTQFDMDAPNAVTENNNINIAHTRASHDAYTIFRADSPPPNELFNTNDSASMLFERDNTLWHEEHIKQTSEDTVTAENENENIFVTDPYTTIRNESPVSGDEQDYVLGTPPDHMKHDNIPEVHPLFKVKYKISTIKLSSREKVEKLKELFPDIPVSQLKKCLKRFKGDIDRTIKYLVGQQIRNESKSDDEEDNTIEQMSSQVFVDSRMEAGVAQLQEIFPNIEESLIRDCLLTVGNDTVRATQILLSEDLPDVIRKTKFQIHQASSKRKELSEEEQMKLKHELVNKYGYIEVKIPQYRDKQKHKARNYNINRSNSFKSSNEEIKGKDNILTDNSLDKETSIEEKSTPTSKSYSKKRSR